MDIRTYIAESVRKYQYRLKTVVPLDNKAMDKIEYVLAKYKPLSVSRPKKTLLQKNPLDFIGVENTEVYIVDFETGLPAAPHIVQNEIRAGLNCPTKYVVIRTVNDPAEIEDGKIAAGREMDEEATAKGWKPAALLSQGTPDEVAERNDLYYGNEYNARLIDYLAKLKKEREPMERDSPHPWFSWLNTPKESGEPAVPDSEVIDNNAGVPDIRGIPKPTAHGNLKDTWQYQKRYIDKSGKEHTLTRIIGGEKEN